MTHRVLVDATHYSTLSAGRGIGRYLDGLLSQLAAEPTIELSALTARDSSLPAGIRAIAVRRLFPDRWAYYENLIRLPRDIARGDADVYWSPATDPPRHSPVPWVQTLLDVIPLSLPDRTEPGEGRRWLARGRYIRRATRVVALSRHTADEGIRTLGLDAGNIDVVYPGVDPAFRPPSAPTVVDRPYVVSASGMARHKGWEEALGVIDRLAEMGLPHQLVLTGHPAPHLEPLVAARLAATAHRERVVRCGFVELPDLVALFQGASAVIVPSRYEGFGLPVIEAMACGTPVVSFDNSSLPEAVGDAGVLVTDGDVEAMATALHSVLTDDRRRRELSDAGLEHARSFTWARASAAYAAVFASVAG